MSLATDDSAKSKKSTTSTTMTMAVLALLAGTCAFILFGVVLPMFIEQPPEFPYGNVRGQVSLFGTPIADGRVTFSPKMNYDMAARVPLDKQGNPKKYTSLIKNGSYSCRFLPEGRFYVTFQSYVDGVDVLPGDVAVGLMADITEGELVLDFPLTGTPETPEPIDPIFGEPQSTP